jgi:hypothetical protein
MDDAGLTVVIVGPTPRAVASAERAVAECRHELRLDGQVWPVEPGRSARDRGLADARFRYVLMMDAHHEVVSANVPTLVRAILQTAAAAVYGTVLVRSGTQATGAASNECVQRRLFAANYLDSLAVLDRDLVLAAGGFDGGDLAAFWRRLVRAGGPVVFVPVVAGWADHPPAPGDAATPPADVPFHRYHPALGWLTDPRTTSTARPPSVTRSPATATRTAPPRRDA